MPRDDQKSLKLTSITVEDAAKVLSAAFGRRIDEDLVREVVDDGDLLRDDETFSLIDYVAFLAGEVSSARSD